MYARRLIQTVIGIGLLLTTPLFAATTNPNAMLKTKCLLQYLVDISGKQILSGQESMLGDGAFPSKRDQYVYQKTGKYPAIYTTDFVDGSISQRPTVVSNCKSYAAKGSIIAIQFHMVQPDLKDGSGFSAMNIPGSGYTKVPDILTVGSTLNVEFNKRLDELAGYFKQLETAGITVLWRPFHEMNGDWFWWSYQPRFKELWIYTYNYLTTTKQCNNLLWVFGVNFFGKNLAASNKQSPAYYYPGHQYVDILGCDFYGALYNYTYEKYVHDSLLSLGGGKPIGIAENGDMPDIPAIRPTQPKWAYWSTWWGFEGADKGNTDALYTKNYGDASVITQDEIAIPTTVPVIGPGIVNDEIERNVVSCINLPEGLFITTNGRFDGLTLYGMNGRAVATVYGRGLIPGSRIPAGTYVFRAAGPGMNRNTGVVVRH